MAVLSYSVVISTTHSHLIDRARDRRGAHGTERRAEARTLDSHETAAQTETPEETQIGPRRPARRSAPALTRYRRSAFSVLAAAPMAARRRPCAGARPGAGGAPAAGVHTRAEVRRATLPFVVRHPDARVQRAPDPGFYNFYTGNAVTGMRYGNW